MQFSSRRQTLLIGVFLVLVVIFMAAFRMGVVTGESMSPTFSDGQVVLVRRMATLGRKLHRGDVVLVHNDHDVIIKRVFRLPGEEIDHSFPDVLRSTERRDLTDYYEQKTINTPTGPQKHYYVPDGYLVVIGDNTSNSEDSRVFGPVSIKDVLGVVVRSPPAPYTNSISGGISVPNQNSSSGELGGANGYISPDNHTLQPDIGREMHRRSALDPYTR
jgi:signal peptidase I